MPITASSGPAPGRSRPASLHSRSSWSRWYLTHLVSRSTSMTPCSTEWPEGGGSRSSRDALRSTRKRVGVARGLNLVVLTVGLQLRLPGMTISIPVNLRLHRKDGPTMLALAAEMMAELASWFPSTRFVLCGDGAYATLAGNHLAHTAVVSRMRRDAALYEAPPSRTNRRGRPKKGVCIDAAVQLAKAATSCQVVELDWRGHKVTKLLSRVASYGTGSTRTRWCASSSS